MTRNGSPDATLIWNRLEAMGVMTGHRPDNLEVCVSAIQIFPWWMMVIHDADRAHNSMSHLGTLLCRTKHGIFASGGRFNRPFDILCCSVPIGTPAQVSDTLRDAFLRGISQPGDSDDAVTALLALAHLEFVHGVHAGRFLEVISLINLESGDPLRAALNIVGKHQILDAIEWVTKVCADCKNDLVVIAAAGVLAKLGEPGRAALSRNLGGSPSAKAIRKAACETLAGTFDGLDAFLSNCHSWEQRGAAARLLGNLVEAGAPAEPALEILLERLRVDDDPDNRAVIAGALAKALRQIGKPRLAQQLLREEKVARDGELYDAILFSGLDITDDALPFLSRVKSRGGEVNRLLTAHGVLPPALQDWFSQSVIKELQWGDWSPPKAVRAWFENAGCIEPLELAESINANISTDHEGALAVEYLRTHPEASKAFERLRIVRMNFGHQASWDVFSATLAGSGSFTSAEPAELRCAFGEHAGPPPAPTPRAIGRLLAVASSGLPNGSRAAMRLLSVMGEDTRILTAECLSSLPSGIRSLAGAQCEPSQTGLGVLGLTDTGLGTSGSRPADPASLPESFQILFGHMPAAWHSNPSSQLAALILAAHGKGDWFGALRKWGDKSEVKDFVESVPAEALCRAIIAIRHGCNSGMKPVALALSQALASTSIPPGFQCFFGSTENGEPEAQPEAAAEDDDECDFDAFR